MVNNATYRYYTTDLLTNNLLAEIPFSGVQWSRALRRAGTFSGSIQMIAANDHMDLYNNTMPGRTGLYVVRDGVCVWGGIIWSRSYEPKDRMIQIEGSEFISYLYHRFIWKSLLTEVDGKKVNIYAAEQPVQIGKYELSGGVATITTRDIVVNTKTKDDRPHGLKPGDDVYISGIDSRLTGGFEVYETYENSDAISTGSDVITATNVFRVLVDSEDTITATNTTLGTFYKTIDNFKFVRDVISRTAEDFAGIEVVRDKLSAGLESTLSVLAKKRVDNIATLTVDGAHGLIPGQEITVKDIDDPSTERTVNQVVVSGTGSGKKAVFTTTASHLYKRGDRVTIAGMAGGDAGLLNGVQVISGITDTTFTVRGISSVVDEATYNSGTTGWANGLVSMRTFDGIYTVIDTPSDDSFTFYNEGNDFAETDETGLRVLNIAKFSVNKGYVTIETDAAHAGLVGDEIIIDANRPPGRTTITAPDMDVFDEVETIDAIYSANNKKLSYQRTSTGVADSFWYLQRDINAAGLTYNSGADTWTVRIGTETPHNYLAEGRVNVVGLTLPYIGKYEIDTIVDAYSFTYKIDRNYKITKRFSTRGNIIIFTTDRAHGLAETDTVVIENYGAPNTDDDGTGGYNGTWTVYKVLQSNRFAIIKQDVKNKKVKFAKDSDVITILEGGTADLYVGSKISGSGLPTNAVIKSKTTDSVTISKKTSEGRGAPVTTATGSNNSKVITVNDASKILVDQYVSGNNIPADTQVMAIKDKKIKLNKALTGSLNGNVTFTNRGTFTFVYPEDLGESGVDGEPSVPATAIAKATDNKEYKAITVSRDEIICATDYIQIEGGGSIKLGPRVYAGTYGGFAEHADVFSNDVVSRTGDSTEQKILGFAEESYAGAYSYKSNFIGSNLQSVGDILEEVSNGTDGFEYRIDCAYDPVTGKFKRTFVVAGYDVPALAKGEVRTIESLGADQYVFEYPGNIKDFGLDESATDSATRMWVTGSVEGASGSSRQPMAAATKLSYLNDGWPLLDATEQVDGISNKTTLYSQAKSFLEESLPPIDDLSVTVNGSVDPVIGTYSPGDWCSLVFDDLYMKARLLSKQEPRDNVIVRKIVGYKVSVPDGFGIPETVTLDLVRDTEVDTIGN